MSVRPISFDDGSGMWEYYHDEENHGGVLDPSTVEYSKQIEGNNNYNMIRVPCPEDDGVSFWPVGGGADALMGQTMFVIKELEIPQNKDLKVDDASDNVKQRVIDTDGEERWVLDDAALNLVAQITKRERRAAGSN